MITDIHSYYDYVNDIMMEFLFCVKAGEPYIFNPPKIQPTRYKTALSEFSRYGRLMRFPVKYINKWKDIIIKNTAMLECMTDLQLHSSNFPLDEVNDMFNTEHTGPCEAFNMLCEVNDEDPFPTWSNGQCFISDYGLRPLLLIAKELWEETCPNKILVLINRALNVTHPRSDIAELFIVGGSDSLTEISN